MQIKSSLIKFFRRFKNRILFFTVFLLFLIIFFFIKNFFSVSVIEIEGGVKLKGLEMISKKIIFLIFSSQTEKKLIEFNPKVKQVKVTKIYPNKIRIKIIQSFPLAVLPVNSGYFILSDDGRILEKKKKNDKKDLSIINYYQKFNFGGYSVGEWLTYQEILTALYFLQKLNYLGLKINAVDIKGLDMLVFNKGDEKFFLTTKRDKNQQYNDLKILIERFKIEKVEYETIDVRFDKPVVKFK